MVDPKTPIVGQTRVIHPIVHKMQMHNPSKTGLCEFITSFVHFARENLNKRVAWNKLPVGQIAWRILQKTDECVFFLVCLKGSACEMRF